MDHIDLLRRLSVHDAHVATALLGGAASSPGLAPSRDRGQIVDLAMSVLSATLGIIGDLFFLIAGTPAAAEPAGPEATSEHRTASPTG